MLTILRTITEKVNRARDLNQALEIIVAEVKAALEVDVCSILLKDQVSEELVLMATRGLTPEAVGKVSLLPGEGLSGLVAVRAEPLNLTGASHHPSYRYFPETGEEKYEAFLGVPIIHHRQLLGVLTLQQSDGRFSEEIETFLITIAAQLAGAIAHAESSGGSSAREWHEKGRRQVVKGLAGAPGVAIGQAMLLDGSIDLESVIDKPVADIPGEVTRFKQALQQVKDDLNRMLDALVDQIPDEERAIFDAYLMLLDGRSFSNAIIGKVEAGNWAPGAIRDVVDEHVQSFKAMDDPYLRERADDIRDLGRRVLQRLVDSKQQGQQLLGDTILVANEVTASMIAEFPLEHLRGVVSRRGSVTSHTAILARALNIPAVLGVGDLPLASVSGCELIVDGDAGEVHLQPSEELILAYRRRQERDNRYSAELSSIRELPAETTDGHTIRLYANTGLLADIQPARNSGSEGIGLYRTEYPFMTRDRFPGEEEQYRLYRNVLETFAGQPVTMRTLDIGGDKALPYFPIEEDNPFLGWRGIRFTLDHPEIFLVQIRAMLRANAGMGNLRIMLPMITHLTELDDSLILIQQAYKELCEELGEIEMPQIGVMIEVPSAVYQVNEILQRVDFLSVGSNDLTQYLLAVDRNNPRVASLYNSLHPAVLMALRQISDAGRAVGKEVSICGEMAGDPVAVLLMLGMGITSFSTNASSLPKVKWVVRRISLEEAQGYAARDMNPYQLLTLRHYIERLLPSKEELSV